MIHDGRTCCGHCAAQPATTTGTCELCKAKPGQPCKPTPLPLHDRATHIGRVTHETKESA